MREAYLIVTHLIQAAGIGFFGACLAYIMAPVGEDYTDLESITFEQLP